MPDDIVPLDLEAAYGDVCVDADFAYRVCFPCGGVVGPPTNPAAWLPDQFGSGHTIADTAGDVAVDPDFAYPTGDLQLYNPDARLADDFGGQHCVVTPRSL